jgi:hypothetical protein
MAELPLSPEMMPQQGGAAAMQAPVDDGTVTISITRDAEGNYSVEKESPAEEAAEGAMPEGSPEEMMGNATKARDLNEALKITQSMFEEGDAASAEALFAQGFTGDTQAVPAGKPPMM